MIDNSNRILGCPKHGSKYGKEVMSVLRYKDGNKRNVPSYRCEKCKKKYVELPEMHQGKLLTTSEGYEVFNIIGPYLLPEQIFLYDKKTNEGICACKGKLKEKTKTITHFIMSSGETESINGAKVCRECKKVFITEEEYLRKRDFFKKNNVNIIFIGEETSTTEKTIDKEKELQNTSLNIGWENEVFCIEDNEKINENLSELKPANKVAAAYYDANITFNPYQYLPWLKVFINNTNDLLISDEVGLGKTIEAGILIKEELTENVNAKIIVICPAFLREKWYQELYDKFYLDSQIYDGKETVDPFVNIIILPLSRLKSYLENESFFDFSMVVIDEIHYFKNEKSIRYGHLREILNRIGESRRIYMSATPVNNSGNDYHSIEKLFSNRPVKTNTTKRQAYIELPERNIRDVYVTLSNEEQIFYNATDELDPFSGTIYRHIGASCLKALSRYAFEENNASSETREELRNALSELFFEFEDFASVQSCLSKIKKLPEPKKDSKLEKLQEIIASFPCGCKIIVFSHYIETVKYLHSELSGTFSTGYIYANTISNNIPCKNIKNKFIDAKAWLETNSLSTTVLICSDACREGIDLDLANVLINYDLPFNPSILEQRIGRIDRMNQKRNMEIYNFHVVNTYDDRLHFILSAKLRFINYYADYGIGNPLNIAAGGNNTFDSFIRYFVCNDKTNKYAEMSNDDFRVASKILRQVGVTLTYKKGMNSNEMQNIILELFENNQQKIEAWFGRKEINNITNEQLKKKRDELKTLLNFPDKIKRKIILENNIIGRITERANVDPAFRKKISPLILNYNEKLYEMEITGLPMHIKADELKNEYDFGVEGSEGFIQNSIIELLRNEGAKVYEIE